MRLSQLFTQAEAIDVVPTLVDAPIYIRPPKLSDFKLWAELRDQNRDHLQFWEPTWPEDDLTEMRFQQRIKFYNAQYRHGHGAPFFIFLEDDRLIGACTLSNIRHGVAQMANLGYWLGAEFTGQGYASQAVQLCLYYAKKHLELCRIEAATLPENTASKKLLQRLGFEHEGHAKSYLKINGKRQGHDLFGLDLETSEY